MEDAKDKESFDKMNEALDSEFDKLAKGISEDIEFLESTREFIGEFRETTNDLTKTIETFLFENMSPQDAYDMGRDTGWRQAISRMEYRFKSALDDAFNNGTANGHASGYERGYEEGQKYIKQTEVQNNFEPEKFLTLWIEIGLDEKNEFACRLYWDADNSDPFHLDGPDADALGEYMEAELVKIAKHVAYRMEIASTEFYNDYDAQMRQIRESRS